MGASASGAPGPDSTVRVLVCFFILLGRILGLHRGLGVGYFEVFGFGVFGFGV